MPARHRASFPLRLWKKAKAGGQWNPDDIDLTADRELWLALSASERECLNQLFALFYAGEQSVVHNLAPLIQLVTDERRLDEQLYLSSFLMDEAKHVDIVGRVAREVCGTDFVPSRAGHAASRRVLEDEVQHALSSLYVDTSVEAQINAAVTYHIVVEGIMAEAGYFMLHRILSETLRLPGVKTAVEHIQRDEARHIAYGIFFISRLVVEHGNRAYRAFLDRMSALKPLVECASAALVSGVEHEAAFGVVASELRQLSARRFSGRVQRIIRARTQTMAELNESAAVLFSE